MKWMTMLVLSRKRNEQIMIGDEIVLTIVDIRGDKVRLGAVCVVLPAMWIVLPVVCMVLLGECTDQRMLPAEDRAADTRISGHVLDRQLS